MKSSAVPEFYEEILWTLMPLIIILNFMVAFTIIRTPRLQITANYFVVAKACCDLFVGIVFLPILVSKRFPIATGALTTLTFLTSLGFNCACTYDRFVAVVQALRYHELMTKRKALFIIGFIFSLAIVVTFIPLLWLNKPNFLKMPKMKVYIGCVTLTIVVATFCQMGIYACLFYIATKHSSEMRRIQRNYPKKEDHRPNTVSKNLHNLLDNMRLVKSFMLVNVTFFFFWLPLGYINIVSVIFNRDDLVPVQLKEMSFYSEFISSIIHPILYGWFQKKLRHSMLSFIPKINQSPNTELTACNESPSLTALTKRDTGSASVNVSYNTNE